ncbi:putative pre-mRNA-splicing factor SPF27 [Blattamonas nauphoetae]|uniref:Pre-mRNA-splicing factor SPF27 n=1 Tax=Blattamonas nauphoetae TaxID=2049346 RepID=A0ABQ9Y9K2_9EUKA|nr:putative pre-mRNA-splicing factor SPF27 [Blattamonas nauphoetae]
MELSAPVEYISALPFIDNERGLSHVQQQVDKMIAEEMESRNESEDHFRFTEPLWMNEASIEAQKQRILDTQPLTPNEPFSEPNFDPTHNYTQEELDSILRQYQVLSESAHTELMNYYLYSKFGLDPLITYNESLKQTISQQEATLLENQEIIKRINSIRKSSQKQRGVTLSEKETEYHKEAGRIVQLKKACDTIHSEVAYLEHTAKSLGLDISDE